MVQRAPVSFHPDLAIFVAPIHTNNSCSFFSLLRTIYISPIQTITLPKISQCTHPTQVIHISTTPLCSPHSIVALSTMLGFFKYFFLLRGLGSNSVPIIALSCHVSWVPLYFPVFIEPDSWEWQAFYSTGCPSTWVHPMPPNDQTQGMYSWQKCHRLGAPFLLVHSMGRHLTSLHATPRDAKPWTPGQIALCQLSFSWSHHFYLCDWWNILWQVP